MLLFSSRSQTYDHAYPIPSFQKCLQQLPIIRYPKYSFSLPNLARLGFYEKKKHVYISYLLITGKLISNKLCLHAADWLILQPSEGGEWSIMLSVPGSCFLILHCRKGEEEFPDCVLRDQAPVAKRLMESPGPKEWQEWVTDWGKQSVSVTERVEIKRDYKTIHHHDEKIITNYAFFFALLSLSARLEYYSVILLPRLAACDWPCFIDHS